MFTSINWDTIDGVVLDAVGTLIEPFPPVADVYAQAARRQGVPLLNDEVKSRFHRHFRGDEHSESHGPLTTDEATEVRRWRRIVANVLPEVPDPERAFEELWAHFAQPVSWRCFPDVPAALSTLAGTGRSIGVASNFDARLRGIVGGLAPLDGRINALIISSEVGFRKPHPAIYRAACERLRLAPGRVLCVGDDLENDVTGAIGSGLRGVWLDRRGEGNDSVPWISDLMGLWAGWSR